jgi:hypothetical protein
LYSGNALAIVNGWFNAVGVYSNVGHWIHVKTDNFMIGGDWANPRLVFTGALNTPASLSYSLDTTVPGIYNPSFCNYAFNNYLIDGNGVVYYYSLWYNRKFSFIVCGNENLYLRNSEAFK